MIIWIPLPNTKNNIIMLKFKIQSGVFTYSVDWSVNDTVEDGFVKEYFPTVEESIEALLDILSNIHSKRQISDALASGLDAMDYSEKGRSGKEILRQMHSND